MKKNLIKVIFTVIICTMCVACGKEDNSKDVKPNIAQMKSICELATMECYYHNVAKYEEKDVEGILLWKKDKRFWMEYSGTVKVGIDASKLSIEVKGDKVKIVIPEAEVLGDEVDEQGFTKSTVIKEEDSADVTSEDQTKALKDAQSNMVKAAKNDTVLLANAQERAKTLLEEYVNNIGNAIGKKYVITWVDYKE